MPSAVLPVFVAYVSPTPPTDELRQTTVVDRSGIVFGFLGNAVHGDITFELNRWGSGTVTLTADDPDTAYAIGGQLREIQLCRGDQILLWGPITDAQVQHNQVTLTVSDPLWYLTRTYIGGPGRPLERLTNPSFSSGTSGWRVRKIASFSGVEPVFTGTTAGEVTTVTSPTKDGRAAQITATVAHAIFGAIGGTGEIFLDQEFTVVGGTRGVQVTFSAWARVNSSGFGSVNDEGVQSALQLRVYPVGYTQDVAQLVDHTETQFDVKHAVDVFVKHEQSISVPSGQTYRVQCRLASLSGRVQWDACSVRYDDALFWFQSDQGTIVSDLVAHAQDSAFGRTTFNLACPAVTTGIVRDLVLLEADMQDIFGAIEQLFTPSDGVDISVDYTSTTRTVRIASPTRGARRPECELRLGRNITSYTYTPAPAAAANTVRIGATGSASTASPFASGIILEDVAPAPPDISADLHNLVAARRLAEVLLPDTVQATTTVRGQAVTGTGGQLLGVLQCGDVVPVTITQGAIDLQADYRVTKMVIHADDTMTLSLDRATFGQRIKRIPLDHLVDRKIEDIVKRLTTVERSLSRPGSTASSSPTATSTIPTSELTIAGLLPVGGTVGQVVTKLSSANYDADWETLSGTPTLNYVDYQRLQYGAGHPGFLIQLDSGGAVRMQDYYIDINPLRWLDNGAGGYLSFTATIVFNYGSLTDAAGSSLSASTGALQLFWGDQRSGTFAAGRNVDFVARSGFSANPFIGIKTPLPVHYDGAGQQIGWLVRALSSNWYPVFAGTTGTDLKHVALLYIDAAATYHVLTPALFDTDWTNYELILDIPFLPKVV